MPLLTTSFEKRQTGVLICQLGYLRNISGHSKIWFSLNKSSGRRAWWCRWTTRTKECQWVWWTGKVRTSRQQSCHRADASWAVRVINSTPKLSGYHRLSWSLYLTRGVAGHEIQTTSHMSRWPIRFSQIQLETCGTGYIPFSVDSCLSRKENIVPNPKFERSDKNFMHTSLYLTFLLSLLRVKKRFWHF